ncbi:MAG: glycosyltransferase family 1 protein [Niabella sp.]
MTIAFNCWVLRNKNIDGIGNVVIETLRPMIKAHPEVKFLLLCDKNFTEDYFDFPNAIIHRIFPPYRHPALYVFYLELILPAFLKKYKPDIFIGMDGMISLQSTSKQISVIHDLNFEHYPKTLPLRNRLYYRFFYKKFSRKADRIVTVSEFTKNDIVNLYHIAPSKINVISLGAKEVFKPLPLYDISATRNKYTGGAPYFFFVGSMHARKNIQRLMQAFELFKQKNNSTIKLIIAGNILWEADEIKSVYNQLSFKTDIIFTGRIDDKELSYLLGAAFALTFIPLFEGFGLPIVEAFQAGVAVICSNTSSMPEVAGDAALLVDPFSIAEIASAMKKITEDEELRKRLIQKGLNRKNIYDWNRTANMLYEAIHKTITAKQSHL